MVIIFYNIYSSAKVWSFNYLEKEVKDLIIQQLVIESMDYEKKSVFIIIKIPLSCAEEQGGVSQCGFFVLKLS